MDAFWFAVSRQIYVQGLVTKNIEQYGVLRLTEKGQEFLLSPSSFTLTEDHNYTHIPDDDPSPRGGGGSFDTKLLGFFGGGDDAGSASVFDDANWFAPERWSFLLCESGKV